MTDDEFWATCPEDEPAPGGRGTSPVATGAALLATGWIVAHFAACDRLIGWIARWLGAG